MVSEISKAANEGRSVLGEVSNTRNVSKTPVIDIECSDDGDDEWTDSWLLKEVRCNFFELLLNLRMFMFLFV